MPIFLQSMKHTILNICESESCSVMSDTLRPHGLYSPWNSPGQNTGVGSRSLLKGIFPTQGLNPGLLHCRWILYQLSHQGSLYLKLSDKNYVCNSILLVLELKNFQYSKCLIFI